MSHLHPQPQPILPLLLDQQKRLRKEIGKLGRNLRHKLLCGFFSHEINGQQLFWESDNSLLPTKVADLPHSPV
jgi:transcriptional regulator of met regulon